MKVTKDNLYNMKLTTELKSSNEIISILENFPVAIDLVTTFIGKKIGYGCYRDVYQYNLNDKYVIKLERENTDCNTVEYLLWNEIRGLCGNLAWVKDWFAPVNWISPNGKILVMEKTIERPNKKKPSKIPKFLWDVKEDNFGWIGNKYVCHDYGQFYNFIKYDKKMQDAVWTKYE